jgi:hypothetical protein
MNFINKMEVGEGINLPRPGCRSSDVDGSNRTLFTKDDGAAGQGLEITGMANLNPGDLGDGIQPFHLLQILSKRKKECQ